MNTVFRTRILAFVATLGLTFYSAAAVAQEPPPESSLSTNQFDYEYVKPTNPAHMPIYTMMQEMRILEKFQAFLSPFRLQKKLMLRLEGCDGVANAYFWDDAVKVCYEYLEYVWKNSPKMVKQGLSPKDAMVGPTVEVFLHEVGHAIVETLEVPFFGREEEVADYFATYILLQFCKDDARRLILGASFLSGKEAMDEQGKAPELRLLGDAHSLPAQRYFNRWCMAYGSDPVLFADAVEMGMLPKHRAKNCGYEFRTNQYAFRKLIEPYIDQELKKKVASRPWFQFETPVAATMIAPSTAVASENQQGILSGARPQEAPALR